MTALERRVTVLLALILLARMLGLFIVLPVLSPWALTLAGSPGVAVGLAVGIYGLTQALLQLPLGWLSDRIGRKPVMLGGLGLFVVGSVLAALARDIDALIVARLLQGCGAIAATSTALLADLLRERVRSIAFAVVGISIGMAFLLSLLAGPALLIWTGVPGLFWLATGLGLVALVLVLALPAPARLSRAPVDDDGFLPRGAGALILAVGVLHAVLAALFVALPLALSSEFALAESRQWQVWLPTVALSMLVVFPLLRWVESRDWQWRVLPWMFVLLAASSGLLAVVTKAGLVLALCAYFIAFNMLEASLPALLTRLVGATRRGRVMGLFSTAQFFGMFVGGGLAGTVHAQVGYAAVMAGTGVLALVPLLALLRRVRPQAVAS